MRIALSYCRLLHCRGRCTDGMWLSARHVVDRHSGREVLILFLDCEGIGSLERTPMEDMLHCLLAGAVSSLTLFKTSSAFDRCGCCALPSMLLQLIPRQLKCGNAAPVDALPWSMYFIQNSRIAFRIRKVLSVLARPASGVQEPHQHPGADEQGSSEGRSHRTLKWRELNLQRTHPVLSQGRNKEFSSISHG